ncbi:single-stranded DNA-binding protein [Deinococcus sp. S9]|uniref:single-stranded DNA-binding protein n=1 Tax=Deinococcus sp. S9 TaxID=2545754 RepID=UPI001056A29D|nr:single-stranded DNA-binding protein [Deinococcus sp. S9]TDE87371.1 hypothetical protein E0686_02440 [Deinococcus sp. S9]
MASNANFVTVLGVVARKPELRGEYKRLVMSVGGIQRVGDRDTIFFQQVRAGGDEGKFAAQIEPGTPVLVKGLLRHETWTTDDGEKKSLTYLKANAIRRLPNPEQFEVEQRITPAGEPYFLLKDGYISITAEGNLSRAELRYMPDGTALLTGSFGCKEEWIADGETKEHTNWLNFQVWGPEAETLAQQNIGKGWSISVIDGIIRNSSSKSKSNGKTYQNTDIEVGGGRMEFLPKRGSGGSAGGSLDIDAALDLPDLDNEESGLPF